MRVLGMTTTLIYLDYDQNKLNCSQMLVSPYIQSGGVKVVKVNIYTYFFLFCYTIKTNNCFHLPGRRYVYITVKWYKPLSKANW